MSIFRTLFGADSKPRSILDEVKEVSGRLIVRGYREVGKKHGCAPTAKTTDQKIMEIYTMVGAAFEQGAKQRGEHIPALYKNHIVIMFIQLHSHPITGKVLCWPIDFQGFGEDRA